MFEYKIELGNWFEVEQLNQWGREGWEYCGSIPTDPNRLPRPEWKYEFIFKRRIDGQGDKPV